MERYFDLALLILSFAIFVGIWIYVQKSLDARKIKKSIPQKLSNDERIVKSQNSFLAFYGIKIALDPDNYSEHEDCYNQTDPRCQLAKTENLETVFDRLTNGEDYFLYIGKKLGRLGVEYSDYDCIETEKLQNIISRVDTTIKSLGYSEIPALHVQSIYDY